MQDVSPDSFGCEGLNPSTARILFHAGVLTPYIHSANACSGGPYYLNFLNTELCTGEMRSVNE